MGNLLNLWEDRQPIRIRLSRSIRRLMVAVSALVALSACRNDHCDDLMFAPTNILFYSEVDTSVMVRPYALYIQGVGVDSIIHVDEKNMVEVALDNSSESCRFAFAVTSEHSLSDTLYLSDEGYRLVGEKLNVTYGSYERVGSNALIFDDDFNTIRVLNREIEENVYLMDRPEVDTLVFQYTNLIEFVSAECGCLTTHRIKDVRFLHNGIGTVAVVDSVVTNLSDAKNIKLYLENY